MAEPIYKKTKVQQTFNLKEIFDGISFKDERALKEAIGQAIIDKIIERTKSGVDINGKAFKNYSKSYIESDEFKAFGKNKKEVNLTLSGAMLDTMDIISEDGNKITIGWDDDTEIAKAFNHNTGDTVSKRQFFGLKSKDIKEIKSLFYDDVKQALEIKKDEGKKAFEDYILENIDLARAEDGEG
jgi:hypothetical protein